MNKSEVAVYLANIKNADYRSLYEAHKLRFEPRRIMRIESSINEKQKKVLVCTGVVLSGALSAQGVTADEIIYGPADKPEIRGKSEVFFNISHSGDYVMIAVGGQPLGADIQKPVLYRESLVARICSDEEREANGTELVKHLNLVWAIKEAYTKLIGEGISKDLRDITYERIDNSILVRDRGEDAAQGIVAYSDDLYEAVVVAREPFHISSLNKLDL